ncbi:helix-turn-helix domain-containing protein [Flavicella sediminum]|uniref:helix-turn-helix domain-containing protein n=1 Tax=Flavicella sediminum TaxID=2585141 RepID=UPI0011223083|nr:helix-turn-helix transcriptional regulator [Flavicella sediminum]
MKIYSGPYLNVKFEKKNNRFINSWRTPPDSVESFKKELLAYRSALEEVNPIQIIWLQQNFKFNIDDATKLWVEENILKPRYEAGYVVSDEDGYHPIAFVVGQDILSHMEVMGVFDEPSPSVFKPKHFATEKEAEDWLDNSFSTDTIENEKTEIIFKGLGDNGKAILEVRSPTSEIVHTIKSFKTILEENEFMKSHVDKYASLSKREIEVLSLLGKGVKHQEIADQLFVSIHTVRVHLKNLKQKLEVKSNSELFQYFTAFIKK